MEFIPLWDGFNKTVKTRIYIFVTWGHGYQENLKQIWINRIQILKITFPGNPFWRPDDKVELHSSALVAIGLHKNPRTL